MKPPAWLFRAFLISVGVLVQGSAHAEDEKAMALRANMRLHTDNVLVGEPLVMTVMLTNTSQTNVVTPYHRPSVFRNDALIDFDVFKGKDVVLSRPAPLSGSTVLRPSDELLRALGVAKFSLHPGASVKAERTMCLATGQRHRDFKWLEPGPYSIQATVRLQGHKEQFVTEAKTFTVRPLDSAEQKALALWTTDLTFLLEGTWGKPTKEMLNTAGDLKKRFPALRHREYIEYRILRACDSADTYRPKAMAYLKEFPKSPYRDDILWWLAHLEIQARHYTEAMSHFKTLVNEHPDSPLKQETEEALSKLRSRLGKEPPSSDSSHHGQRS